jgi:hypothetical protein
MAVCRPAWLETVQASYQPDPEAQARLVHLSAGDASEVDFELKNGVIRWKGRIWIGNDPDIQIQLIRSLHDSAVGGHSGFFATYHRIRRLFAWAGMKSMVHQFCQRMCHLPASEDGALPSCWTAATPGHSWTTLGSYFNGFHRRLAAVSES